MRSIKDDDLMSVARLISVALKVSIVLRMHALVTLLWRVNIDGLFLSAAPG